MFSPGDWGVLTTTLVIGVVTLLIVKMWQTYRFLTTFKRMGIPGPTPLPMVGNTLTLSKKTIRETFQKWDEQFGKIYGIFFPEPTLVVNDFDLIREVVVKKFSSFSDRKDFFLLNKDEATKDSLVSIQGDHWKHVRGQLSPAFSSTRLKQMMPAMDRVAQNLRTCLAEKAAKGEELELKDLCKSIAMDVIAGVTFGLQVDSLQGASDRFYQHVDHMITSANTRVPLFVTFPLLGTILAWLGITPLPKDDVNYLVSVLDAALKERQLDAQRHGDFLQLLVDAQKASSGQEQVDAEIDFTQQLRTSSGWNRKGLTVSEMHANSIIFLFAGNDTVASVLSMTLYCLAANPDCLRKAQEEVDEKIGKKPVNYDAAMGLNYIDMCLNETIRLHVPGLMDRVVSEDVDIGGYHLPKGWRVAIPSGIIHMDPELWPDPEQFDPERFTAEARAARPPLAFLPFGLGPRNCIGMRFAQLETRLMLATILQCVSPVLTPKSVYPPVLKPLSLAVRDGLWVKLEPREK